MFRRVKFRRFKVYASEERIIAYKFNPVEINAFDCRTIEERGRADFLNGSRQSYVRKRFSLRVGHKRRRAYYRGSVAKRYGLKFVRVDERACAHFRDRAESGVYYSRRKECVFAYGTHAREFGFSEFAATVERALAYNFEFIRDDCFNARISESGFAYLRKFGEHVIFNRASSERVRFDFRHAVESGYRFKRGSFREQSLGYHRYARVEIHARETAPRKRVRAEYGYA